MLLFGTAVPLEIDFKSMGGLDRFLGLLTNRFGELVMFCVVDCVFEIELISFLAFNPDAFVRTTTGGGYTILLSWLRAQHSCFPLVLRSNYVSIEFVDC